MQIVLHSSQSTGVTGSGSSAHHHRRWNTQKELPVNGIKPGVCLVWKTRILFGTSFKLISTINQSIESSSVFQVGGNAFDEYEVVTTSKWKHIPSVIYIPLLRQRNRDISVNFPCNIFSILISPKEWIQAANYKIHQPDNLPPESATHRTNETGNCCGFPKIKDQSEEWNVNYT